MPGAKESLRVVPVVDFRFVLEGVQFLENDVSPHSQTRVDQRFSRRAPPANPQPVSRGRRGRTCPFHVETQVPEYRRECAPGISIRMPPLGVSDQGDEWPGHQFEL